MLYEKELDAVLQEIIARWDIPGLAVGIVQGKEIVYTRCFGVQSLETKAPVTLDSVFCTASVSKCFVATAVMQLAERGKVDLDAPILRYLPYFRLDDERYRQITIRQILTHTSGMPDMDEQEYVEFVARAESDEGAVERYVRSLSSRKMIANPGEQFYYSNIAYDLLGDMIAKVTGRSFEQAIREDLLIPSGMLHSTFLLAEVPPASLAIPHLRSPEMRVVPSSFYHRGDAPASFLHTTLPDMCQWGITMLKRGNDHGESILSSATYERMWSPVIDRGDPPPPPGMYEKMGLGWTLGHFKEVSTISHGGMGFGSAAFFMLLPEMNCAGVVLCNQESSARTRIVNALADTMIDQKPQAFRVSWMIPVSRALAQGGIQAAYACAAEIRAAGEEEYFQNPYELASLAQELLTAGRLDLSVAVMEMNLQFFPEDEESRLVLARLRKMIDGQEK